MQLRLAYASMLPLLWLSSLFGNQVWYPGIHWLGVTFFYISLIAATFALLKVFGVRLWPYALLAAIVTGRLALHAELPGGNFFYFGSMFALFAVAGVQLATDAPEILERQSRIFFSLSVPILVLQLAGAAEWLHAFNTLYAVVDINENVYRPTIRMLPTLFVTEDELMSTMYSDFRAFLPWQVRPPGLTHSSALLSILILAGTALHFGRINGTRSAWYDSVLVATVVLAGSKLALVGFIVMLFWAFFRFDAAVRRRLKRMAAVLVLALLAYAILFPAAFARNLSIDQYEVSIFIRVADALLAIAPDIAVQLPVVLDTVNTYYTTFSYKAGTLGELSGIATLLVALPFVAVGVLVALPWIKRGLRYCRAVYPETARTAELMVLAMVGGAIATPIFGSQFFPMMFGVALVPFATAVSAKLRQRVVRAAHRPPRNGRRLAPSTTAAAAAHP